MSVCTLDGYQVPGTGQRRWSGKRDTKRARSGNKRWALIPKDKIIDVEYVTRGDVLRNKTKQLEIHKAIYENQVSAFSGGILPYQSFIFRNTRMNKRKLFNMFRPFIKCLTRVSHPFRFWRPGDGLKLLRFNIIILLERIIRFFFWKLFSNYMTGPVARVGWPGRPLKLKFKCGGEGVWKMCNALNVTAKSKRWLDQSQEPKINSLL